MHTNAIVPAAAAAIAALGISAGCARQSFERFFSSGEGYLTSRKYAEAAIQFQNAARLNPGSAEAQLRLGDTYAAMHEPSNAGAAYARACALDEHAVAGCIDATAQLLKAGDYTGAAAQARIALTRDRFNLDANLLLGSALAGLRLFADAEERIAAAIALAPEEPRAYMALGDLDRQRGNGKAAEAALLKAINLDPDAADARVSLAQVYLDTGRTAAGVEQLRRALDADPTNLEASRTYGTYLVQNKQCDDAEQYWRTVAEQSADSSGALALADYYVVSGRPDDALAVLNQLARKEDGGAARGRIAAITYDRGDHAKAARMVHELLTHDPSNIDALLLKARMAFDDQDTAAAREYAHKAAAVEPDSPAVRQMLAMLMGR